MTIERILLFIRNVLEVPANDNDKRTGNDATVHDEVSCYINTDIKKNIRILLYIKYLILS